MKKRKVLIVDDEQSTILEVTHALKHSYDIIAVRGGKEAFETAAMQQPDIILLDVIMPDVGGYEVIAQLKASRVTRDIPVIFLTANVNPDDETHGLSLGAVDYIFKPFSRGLLMRRIELYFLLEDKLTELATS